MKITDCKLVELSKIGATSGNITSITNEFDAPFTVRRVFYIYDVPSGEDRGAHAHVSCKQLLIAATGSFKVRLFDGLNHEIVELNKPNFGLYIPEGIWASEFDFSGGAICLVLASEEYSESDYIRDYEGFLKFKNEI